MAEIEKVTCVGENGMPAEIDKILFVQNGIKHVVWESSVAKKFFNPSKILEYKGSGMSAPNDCIGRSVTGAELISYGINSFSFLEFYSNAYTWYVWNPPLIVLLDFTDINELPLVIHENLTFGRTTNLSVVGIDNLVKWRLAFDEVTVQSDHIYSLQVIPYTNGAGGEGTPSFLCEDKSSEEEVKFYGYQGWCIDGKESFNHESISDIKIDVANGSIKMTSGRIDERPNYKLAFNLG